MNYKIFNDEKEFLMIEEDAKKVIKKLTTELYNKYILKSKDYKQVQYKYNYNDLQKITFIFSNNYRIIFDEIPTRCGYLNIE